jgi:hypothetical protein
MEEEDNPDTNYMEVCKHLHPLYFFDMCNGERYVIRKILFGCVSLLCNNLQGGEILFEK